MLKPAERVIALEDHMAPFMMTRSLHPFRARMVAAGLIMVWLLAACARQQPSASSPPASAGAARPTLEWQVAIVQDGRPVAPQDGEIVLKAAPFTIQVRVPLLFDIMLNASDTDANARIVRPGYNFFNCPKVFCPATGMAEGVRNEEKALTLDAIGSHYLSYVDDQTNRWSNVDIAADGATYQREVESIDEKPAAEFAGSRIYLIFLIDYRHRYFVDPDEYHTLVLRFEE
jgi:hypothetical protein